MLPQVQFMELKKKKVHEDLKLKPLSLYNKVKMVTKEFYYPIMI